MRDSIEKPLRLVTATMNSRLVERLLNELGDDTSDLPVLQHALNRTYQEFVKNAGDGEIQIQHYLDAGTMESALDKHAGAVVKSLTEAAKPWTERVFRCLTAEEGSRKIRRPVRLESLYQIVGAGTEDEQSLVREVINAYAARGNSLLVCSVDSVIDISHESLITHWSELKDWADKESKSASWYQRAADDTVRHRQGEARTWRDPELSLVLKYLHSGAWNPAWASRLPDRGAGFDEVKAYLELGDGQQRREHEDEEKRRNKELTDAHALAAAERNAKEAQRKANSRQQGLIVLAVCFLVLFLVSQIDRNQILKAQQELQAKLVAAARTGARVNPKDGLNYVLIPPGKFKMGCSVGDSQCYSDESPSHEVHITKGFWLGQTEVTQAAWKKVMSSDPGRFKGDQLPVETISWPEAAKYCETIGGRLPTEAEWEYAARAGSGAARYGELDDVAWYGENSGETTHAVGGKQANQFGLFDMLGNVWEWVLDDYAPYKNESVSDPFVQAKGSTEEVVRGGSWNLDPRYSRASFRNGLGPTLRVDFIGFRCVGEFR